LPLNLDNREILVVDDEKPICSMLSQWLKHEGYESSVASCGEDAIELLSKSRFALMISDINMPGMSGVELLSKAKIVDPDMAVLMATGVSDRDVAIHTMELGACGYVIKPFEFNEMIINISNALHLRSLEIENKAHREKLEELVEIRTEELETTIRQLRNTETELHASREETIQRLSMAAEFRDDDTAKHTVRMSYYCEILARKSNMSDHYCNLVRTASPMHDVGKIGIPDGILLKKGKLTYDEFEIIKKHCEIGYNILVDSHSELLDVAAVIALNHHEKFDGSGYPNGLSGEDIPFEGRIAAISDVFDALTTARVYKDAFPLDKSLAIMKEGSGSHFDAQILDLFFENLDEFLAVKEKFADE
jgi:putative two-component system response regulator